MSRDNSATSYSHRQNETDNHGFLAPKFEKIPATLQSQPWAVWKAEPRPGTSGKFNKAPRSPQTGRKIGANQPALFGTYALAITAYESGDYTGVGILLTGNGIVGVDIDSYVEIFNTKPEVKQWVVTAIRSGVYCEKSPSGTGLRLFMRGALPEGGRKSVNLEIYDNLRFLTVTGHEIRSKVRS